ncbi:uncharacterized protein TNIN_303061 [Trichonephila inaurata madagascariensis]|uniref:Uncharacterized protein n=1 Tax=Trichonephila inaurata madagascariensis TaxID=2747483 RepID=A0A8X6YQ85_9ARAC|nr:uncharacterized protein TNIN_303061 [Trichonephila inaurata madagascariensis]
MSHVQIQIPVFQQNCAAKPIKCGDDCSFLCVEKSVCCAGGVCVLQPDEPVNVIRKKEACCFWPKNPFLIDVSLYRCVFVQCSPFEPDVCEHGVFMYKGRDDYMCICPSPYQKVVLKGKPHCLERTLANFFPEEVQVRLVQEKTGPPTLK